MIRGAIILGVLCVAVTVYTSADCESYEYKCRNGQCIAKTGLCDGDFDCEDQSDEIMCGATGCESYEYKCRNGQCIAKTALCDGVFDCEDQSDEIMCGAKLRAEEVIGGNTSVI